MPGEKMGTASSAGYYCGLRPQRSRQRLLLPDRARYWLPWSAALHYVNTPDLICGYDYDRDCRDAAGTGEKGMCVSGAVKNYTDQLLRHRGRLSPTGTSLVFLPADNLTQSLLFLSHFMADITRYETLFPPLPGIVDLGTAAAPCWVSSDKGGSTIEVHWFSKKSNLHSVWDEGIIETAKQRFYNNSVEAMIQDIDGTSPDAAESVRVACDWLTGTRHADNDYFLTRLPVVYMRLARRSQAGFRTEQRPLGCGRN
ncbi:unnamed protein product [Spirodela intermedia]|uniref:Aspergillus nuclease S1 n=1 Tax=Spirodela intermedia TaxID=51605 RepID=A0ABN7EAU5_SPIIN|nr:unnamed protein product [Spirodela intermedia]